MKIAANRKLAITLIISGSILVLITVLYFILQSTQWVQGNSRWFVFADGIVIFLLGVVFLISINWDKECKK
jgi:hypothetical protein